MGVRALGFQSRTQFTLDQFYAIDPGMPLKVIGQGTDGTFKIIEDRQDNTYQGGVLRT